MRYIVKVKHPDAGGKAPCRHTDTNGEQGLTVQVLLVLPVPIQFSFYVLVGERPCLNGIRWFKSGSPPGSKSGNAFPHAFPFIT
jgi:hypothetical protein